MMLCFGQGVFCLFRKGFPKFFFKKNLEKLLIYKILNILEKGILGILNDTWLCRWHVACHILPPSIVVALSKLFGALLLDVTWFSMWWSRDVTTQHINDDALKKQT